MLECSFPEVKKNYDNISIPDESKILNLLDELSQHEIINLIHSSEEQKLLTISQINRLDSSYPGGLREYISRANKLLLDSKNSVDQFLDYQP